MYKTQSFQLEAVHLGKTVNTKIIQNKRHEKCQKKVFVAIITNIVYNGSAYIAIILWEVFQVKKIFYATLSLFLLLALAACGGDNSDASEGSFDTEVSESEDNDVSSALVGTWKWASDAEWEYVLESDGSGTRNGAEITWSAADGTVTFVGEDEVETSWSYDVDGVLLILTSGTEAFYYVNVHQEPDFLASHGLVGVWANANNSSDILVLESGGSGTIGEAADSIEWWVSPVNNIFVINASHMTSVMLFDYVLEGEDATFTALQGDLIFTFNWLAADLDSVVIPTNMLENIEDVYQLARHVQDLEFGAIVEMVDAYFEEVEASEDDIAHEIRELAARADEIIGQLYVYEDSFDGEITIYHPSIREISDDIHLVSYIRPRGRISETRPRAGANLHINFGFYRNGWLFFDQASLRMSDDSIWNNNFGSFETNRDVIRGGTIREVGPKDWGLVNANSVAPRFIDLLDTDYDHVLRFTNRGDDENMDVQLTESEITALSLVGELFWIMGQLGHSIPDDFS